MIFRSLDTLFLDRDGVINEKIDYGYVLKIDDVKIYPDVKSFLKWATRKFKHIIVVTNQQCVGKGLICIEDCNEINNYINEQLGMCIDDFLVCPHLLQEDCDCRKPKTGLFKQAAKVYDVNFNNSWMIGDSETDLIPAYSLGIKSVFISKSINQIANLTVPSISYLYNNQRYCFFS